MPKTKDVDVREGEVAEGFALNNAAMVVAANALRGVMTHAALHGVASGPEVSVARLAVTWTPAVADGDFGLASALDFTGMTANQAVVEVSLHSAASAGTSYGNFTLVGDGTANAAGEYTVTGIDFNGSAS